MQVQKLITRGLAYLKHLLITRGLSEFFEEVIVRRHGGTTRIRVNINLSYILYGQKEIRKTWKYKIIGRKKFPMFTRISFSGITNSRLNLILKAQGKQIHKLAQKRELIANKQFGQINKLQTQGNKQFALSQDLEMAGCKKFMIENKNKIKGRRDNSKAIMAALYKFE